MDDKVHVIHVEEKPSKEVGKAVKKAAARRLNGAVKKEQNLTM
ncbi:MULTISPECIES: hypothetical protein [unclassified Stenotrophomonas]|nr:MULTISPECIES: hypothetical protein [unclassified Stenotrophomonas]